MDKVAKRPFEDNDTKDKNFIAKGVMTRSQKREEWEEADTVTSIEIGGTQTKS